jgi:iron complex transport system substrate-binding protein
VTLSLPKRPERIVAYVGTAAVLWDFGIRPVGLFGPQRQPDGTPEPAAGSIDLDAVESAGEGWDGANLEALADLQPDLVVSGGVDDPWVIGEQLETIESSIAPVAVVEVYQDTARAIIGNYERLAVALGVDPASAELAAAKAAFEAAADDVQAAAASVPGLKVVATYADTDALYIAKPVDFPDLLEFQQLGSTWSSRAAPIPTGSR